MAPRLYTPQTQKSAHTWMGWTSLYPPGGFCPVSPASVSASSR